MQIDETVHGCPVGRRCGSPDRQVGDPGSPSQIRTTSGSPPLVAAGRPRYGLGGRTKVNNCRRIERNLVTSKREPFPGTLWRVPADWPWGVRCTGGVTLIRAWVRNLGTRHAMRRENLISAKHEGGKYRWA